MLAVQTPAGGPWEYNPEEDERWLGEMAKVVWAVREHKPEEVNRAGRSFTSLISGPINPLDWSDNELAEYNWSRYVINNWRACHAYPLNVLQTNLRRNARRTESAAVVAQRTKRLISIASKLNLRPKMKLTQMQDIGGCRAIVGSVSALRLLDRFYRAGSEMKHIFASRDDYLARPQKTGYRGIHLVYRYHSDKPEGAKFNGLKIEMQLRSLYQHAWATAVETVGSFEGHNLKAGQGPPEWLRFFALMGAGIAQLEETNPVPSTPSNAISLRGELAHYAQSLNVESRLHEYTETLRKVEDKIEDAHYYVLKLDPVAGRLDVKNFHRDQYELAQSEIAEAESAVQGRVADAVLVSVDALAELQRAYPNYYADTRLFIDLMRDALKGRRRRKVDVNQLSLPL